MSEEITPDVLRALERSSVALLTAALDTTGKVKDTDLVEDDDPTLYVVMSNGDTIAVTVTARLIRGQRITDLAKRIQAQGEE